MAGLISADTRQTSLLWQPLFCCHSLCSGRDPWMMGWLAQASFTIFVIYRLGLGVVLFALIGSGVISGRRLLFGKPAACGTASDRQERHLQRGGNPQIGKAGADFLQTLSTFNSFS